MNSSSSIIHIRTIIVSLGLKLFPLVKEQKVLFIVLINKVRSLMPHIICVWHPFMPPPISFVTNEREEGEKRVEEKSRDEKEFTRSFNTKGKGEKKCYQTRRKRSC